jgi:hypothetical protein
VRVVADASDDDSRLKTARVLAVLTSVLLVAAGAIVALICLPGPIAPKPDHVPTLRRLLNQTRPASATVVAMSDENQCESLENRALETLQTSFDLNTIETAPSVWSRGTAATRPTEGRPDLRYWVAGVLARWKSWPGERGSGILYRCPRRWTRSPATAASRCGGTPCHTPDYSFTAPATTRT